MAHEELLLLLSKGKMAVVVGYLFLGRWCLQGVALKQLIASPISVISLPEPLHLLLTLLPAELLLPLPLLLPLDEDVHFLRPDDVLLNDVVGGVIIVNRLIALLFIIHEIDLFEWAGGNGPLRLIFDEGLAHLAEVRVLAMR